MMMKESVKEEKKVDRDTLTAEVCVLYVLHYRVFIDIWQF